METKNKKKNKGGTEQLMSKRSDLGCRKAVVAEAPSYFTHTIV